MKILLRSMLLIAIALSIRLPSAFSMISSGTAGKEKKPGGKEGSISQQQASLDRTAAARRLIPGSQEGGGRIEYSDPILTYFHNIRTSLIDSDLEDTQIDQASATLETQSQFSHLQLPQKQQKDLQLVLASVVSESFFRTTSKLGLSFARQQNIQASFVWMHAFSAAPLSSLEEFRNYVERKPYYNAAFRRNSDGAKYSEAITCSEAPHLGRLKARNEAPSFLSIREICFLDAL